MESDADMPWSDADMPWRDSWPIKDGTEQDTPQQKQSALFVLMITVLPLTVTFAELIPMISSSSAPGNCNTAVQGYW